MTTWLSRWMPGGERSQEEEAVALGLDHLLLRGALGFLLYLAGRHAFAHIPYFPEAWAQFLPILFFFISLVSVPLATFLATFAIAWALLYWSPAYALWFALFMLLLSGIYEDRLEHTILLATTPVLLLYNLGFLPLFIAGVLLRARGGVVNGFGALLAIGIGAATGLQTLEGVLVTGLAAREAPVISPRLDLPNGILDVSWVADLSWTLFATELADLAERLADTFTQSPVVLAQVLVWGFAPSIIRYALNVIRSGLARVPGPNWWKLVVSQLLALFAGILFVLAGYWLLIGSFARGINGGAVFGQLLWSAIVAFVIVLIADAFRLIRSGELRVPGLPTLDLRALLRREPSVQTEPPVTTESQTPPRQ